MSLATQFEQFLAPDPSAVFSHQYFGSLTFEGTLASELRTCYPTILPRHSVKSWTFRDEVCTISTAMTVRPSEMIPHYEDIREIIDQIPEAYARSARSVRLNLLILGCRDVWVVDYHFSKARSPMF